MVENRHYLRGLNWLILGLNELSWRWRREARQKKCYKFHLWVLPINQRWIAQQYSDNRWIGHRQRRDLIENSPDIPNVSVRETKVRIILISDSLSRTATLADLQSSILTNQYSVHVYSLQIILGTFVLFIKMICSESDLKASKICLFATRDFSLLPCLVRVLCCLFCEYLDIINRITTYNAQSLPTQGDQPELRTVFNSKFKLDD